MHSQRSIHPQFPQGYPQIHRRKRPQNRGCAERYPHCPQVIHNARPHGGWLWKPLWIAAKAPEGLFTHVAKWHKYTCSCMFGTKILLQLVISQAGKDKDENVSLLRKRESPKKTAPAVRQTRSLPEYAEDPARFLRWMQSDHCSLLVMPEEIQP